MSKRIVLAVAGGVVAGATVIGVPAFAYATTGDSGSSNSSSSDSTGMTGSQMSSMMNDPAFVDSAKQFMSKMMSDTQLQQQMRSVMGDMGDMGNASGGMMGDSSSGKAAPSTP